MRRLILVRHATAVDKGPEGSDFHRRLKKRGRREAQIMAERVRDTVGTPDQLFSSPADRAIQTALIFAEILGVAEGHVTLREELYGGLLPEEFLHIVHRFDESFKTVMIFGHDPSFTEFASYMLPDFKTAIPKAGVLIMDIDRSQWASVRAGDASLVQFELPPAKDDLKRSDDDVVDRLVLAIRSGILEGVREFGLDGSRDVVKLIARTSAKLARDLRPFVARAEKRSKGKSVASPPKKSAARSKSRRKHRSSA